MSAHELPEDLSRWPSDAYQLLGVAPGVNPRDLRRAYTRLIRTYKPEQYPEHFRRIREAYESLLRYAEWFGNLEQVPEPESPPEQDLPVPDQVWKSDPPLPVEDEEEETVAASRPYRPPDVSQLWQMACDRDAAAAYGRLVQLDETEPGRTDVCLAAYWLLVLEPELDARREPCDWLTRGLETARLSGPLRELYRREIAENPAEALSRRCKHLLRVAAPPGLLADLVEWRWQAAARIGRLAVLGPDLQMLRTHLTREDEETWLRLLLIAAGLVGLAGDRDQRPVFLECLEEIDAYEHLHQRLGYAFDQYEFLREIGDEFKSPLFDSVTPILILPWRRISLDVQELVGLAQKQSFVETRPLLLAFLGRWTSQPPWLLSCFDRVRQYAPAVLSELGNLLQQLADSLPEADDDRDLEDCQDLVEVFWAEFSEKDHQKFRLDMLGFCLREAISPQRAADLLEESMGVEYSQRLRDDWPLQHAWLACHIMKM